ncbi:fatty acid desaturase [Acuticoccus sediminis]|uniref:fatty acid desaturase n=1 Tax=Acuticoccus sediminis TaxID=2184697 RepID=UPI001CFF20F4|nr:fatty acid desaturase [Acuticoccus sediminis]
MNGNVLSPARARQRDTIVGLTLALAIIGAWLAVHVSAIFIVDWQATPGWLALPFVAVQTWLSVGLFIVAHDCMHGSLAPGRPAVNRAFGRVALFLYAAFSYDRLLPKHHMHHRRPGSPQDPDFHADAPDAFATWFLRFFLEYYGWRELGAMAAAMALYILATGVSVPALLLFYAVPAVLSAVQLFYFGTFRPHRIDAAPFADRHNTRTDGFPPLLSLLTCFHFGYHHEHHLAPTTPWWRLPAAHRAMTAGAVPPAGPAAARGRA